MDEWGRGGQFGDVDGGSEEGGGEYMGWTDDCAEEILDASCCLDSSSKHVVR